MSLKWLVTGGAGFIGTNFVLETVKAGKARVLNYDNLTYSGNRENLSHLRDPGYHFHYGDVCDFEGVSAVFKSFQPDAVIHFAAETHVDRSIDSPQGFVRTNVQGCFSVLEACRRYWLGLGTEKRRAFRYLQVSTDEVYGELLPTDQPAKEGRAYQPNSPYAASKAAGDHLVRSYGRTYGLPIIISLSSNNYGPYQFPEKLIPLTIVRALGGRPIGVYGDGMQVRDWVHVSDHVQALHLLLDKGAIGQSYNIGGWGAKSNLSVVSAICTMLDRVAPTHQSYASLIQHVADRPGHDRRYALDSGKLLNELGFRPKNPFDSGLEQTINWYLANKNWWQPLVQGSYKGERLGLLT